MIIAYKDQPLKIKAQVMEIAGAATKPFDITGKTVTIEIVKPDGTKTSTTPTIDNATNGDVSYTVTLDQIGTWVYYFKVNNYTTTPNYIRVKTEGE